MDWGEGNIVSHKASFSLKHSSIPHQILYKVLIPWKKTPLCSSFPRSPQAKQPYYSYSSCTDKTFPFGARKDSYLLFCKPFIFLNSMSGIRMEVSNEVLVETLSQRWTFLMLKDILLMNESVLNTNLWMNF